MRHLSHPLLQPTIGSPMATFGALMSSIFIYILPLTHILTVVMKLMQPAAWFFIEQISFPWQSDNVHDITLYHYLYFSPFRLDHRWLFCYPLPCWSHLSSSHLTECGFHLSNMVSISLSRAVLSEPARCRLDWVVQMHAVGRTVYLENLNSHCLNNFPVKCTASFNYWSLKWGSIKMNDLH